MVWCTTGLYNYLAQNAAGSLLPPARTLRDVNWQEYCINERGYRVVQLWQELPVLAPLYSEFESGRHCQWTV